MGPQTGWRHLIERTPLGDVHVAHPAIPGGPGTIVVDPASPLGAAPVARVAAGGADPPGAGAVAALSTDPLADMVRGGGGRLHLHRSDVVRNVGRESALSALRFAKGRNRVGAQGALAAKIGHPQSVAAVFGEMG